MSAKFAAMHRAGTFLLVNVNDAGSPAVAQAADAVALGTTITEINKLKAQRKHGRNGVRRAIDALVDGGVEY